MAVASVARAATSRPHRLRENLGLFFRGGEPRGRFELAESEVPRLLAARNPHGKPNGDVVRPWAGAADVLHSPRCRWIIDFPPGTEEREAALYERPYALVRRRVLPVWGGRRAAWWCHGRPQVEMRVALAKRERFIASPASGRQHLFDWLPVETLPAYSLVVIARDDDYCFGVLHSKIHERWTRRFQAQAPEARFDTFPFPWAPATPLGKLTRAQEEQRAAIAGAARTLDATRRQWLGDRSNRRHTLTALYNAQPTWLRQTHAALDETVAAAYGWPGDLPDDDILARLFALNHARATCA